MFNSKHVIGHNINSEKGGRKQPQGPSCMKEVIKGVFHFQDLVCLFRTKADTARALLRRERPRSQSRWRHRIMAIQG